jgi:hypothetical protein
MGEPMRALTLIRPWDEPIVDGVKTVENRPWKPWPEVMGELIAIHAGNKYDAIDRQFIEGRGFQPIPAGQSNRTRRGHVVGVARVAGWVSGPRGTLVPDDSGLAPEVVRKAIRSPWYSGPYGWVLEDAVALPLPVTCKGALGLWKLPADVEAAVRGQHEEVRRV